MISITSAQLDIWLAAFVFPLSRLLAFMASAPFFSNAAMPRRIRLIFGIAVTFALMPSLPPMPAIPAGSWLGLMVIAQQIIIGLMMGFALRVAFAAVDFAGELVGLQMGLSFAVFYDPQSSAQTPVLAEFLGLLTTLTFLAMNGHLLAISVLAESFHLLPVALAPITAQGPAALVNWAGILFTMGVLLSLPMIAALLIANLSMGVLARVAPQLNLFAVGFPVTMAAGFTVLLISLPYFGAALERLFAQSFEALNAIMRAAAG